MTQAGSDVSSRRLARLVWLLVGLVCVGVGALGIVVPGLPTTIFFIGAAACFARSSPRLEAWVLDLPGIGRAVRDYRRGLGMPRRAKVFAVGSMIGFSTVAVVWLIEPVPVRGLVAVLALVGTVYVIWRVPTTERVRAEVTPGSGVPGSSAHPPGRSA